MCFKLKYFRNPLDRAWPKHSQKGEHLLNKGLYCLKRKLLKPNSNINPTRNAKKAIHGLAYLYGFRYRSFMNDNFSHNSYSLAKWVTVIKRLNQEVRHIFHYQNISSLLRSRYAKYIQIANINQYYHPRKRHYANHARVQLANLGSDHRYRFTGVFQRFGSKTNGQLTILLTDIKYRGTLVTHHLWFNATKQFRMLGHLDKGQPLCFNARVKSYRKGYLPNDFIKRYDYELTYPSHIRRC